MIYILIVLLVAFGEHHMKNYMEKKLQLGEQREILKGKIILRKHYNTGAMLNFMENKKEVVTTLSCICLGFVLLLFMFLLPKKDNKVFKLGLSLAFGGAISNVTDRIRRGHVVDYFSINCKKLKSVIFNLADIAIFIGSILMFLSSVFVTKRD